MSVDYRLSPVTTTIADTADCSRILAAPVTARDGTHLTDVRFLNLAFAALAISACTATSVAVARPTLAPDATVPPATCAARAAGEDIEFRISVEADARELTRWCRAVGAPVYVEASGP